MEILIKMRLKKEQEILKLIFKDFLTLYNSRNISKIVNISHAGAFKILKKLEKRGLVKAKKIGKAIIYSINKENPLALKEVEIYLLIESQDYNRWYEEFKDLKEKAAFVVLFGSVLKNEKDARDIDLLIVAEKGRLKDIKKILGKRQSLLNKKIHQILQTPEDFRNDIEKKNKILIEIIKTGIVLFGQDKFVSMLK